MLLTAATQVQMKSEILVRALEMAWEFLVIPVLKFSRLLHIRLQNYCISKANT
jgi:hypothetical protein|tara:strand:- start:10509 stop:10667 length:159 start_codon:yes stop_codon:yes gene_type:complete